MLGVLELYCGIGGVAAVLGDAARVVAAVDVDAECLEIYGHNFSHPTVRCAVETLSSARLRTFDADLWWLSPPCQPYTRRGLGRDAEDPRAGSFLRLLARIGELRPRHLAVENVPGFESSATRRQLLATLERSGYREVREQLLCPSELGWPNRRRRYYLLASRERLLPARPSSQAEPPASAPPRLGELVASEPLDAQERAELILDPGLAAAYRYALDVVDRHDAAAVTACFTAAYGRSLVRSGSYLRIGEEGTQVRRFAPREVLRLLGFPITFRLPPGLGSRGGWRRAGNSLSLPCAARVLSQLPGLESLAEPYGRAAPASPPVQ